MDALTETLREVVSHLMYDPATSIPPCPTDLRSCDSTDPTHVRGLFRGRRRRRHLDARKVLSQERQHRNRRALYRGRIHRTGSGPHAFVAVGIAVTLGALVEVLGTSRCRERLLRSCACSAANSAPGLVQKYLLLFLAYVGSKLSARDLSREYLLCFLAHARQ